MNIELRPTTEADLPTLFQHQSDEEGCRMAAFTAADPKDEQAYVSKWTRLLKDPSIVARVILCDGQICGTVAKYEMEGEPEITYWIDRPFWGRGIATEALTLFLREFESRPVNARAVVDNVGSCRVLEKCGFRYVGPDRGYANFRGEEVDEAVYVLTD